MRWGEVEVAVAVFLCVFVVYIASTHLRSAGGEERSVLCLWLLGQVSNTSEDRSRLGSLLLHLAFDL